MNKNYKKIKISYIKINNLIITHRNPPNSPNNLKSLQLIANK